MRLVERNHIDTFFYEDEDGATITVNGDTQLTMTNDFLVFALHGIDVNDVWFQQSTYCVKRLMAV